MFPQVFQKQVITLNCAWNSFFFLAFPSILLFENLLSHDATCFLLFSIFNICLFDSSDRSHDFMHECFDPKIHSQLLKSQRAFSDSLRTCIVLFTNSLIALDIGQLSC